MRGRGPFWRWLPARVGVLRAVNPVRFYTRACCGRRRGCSEGQWRVCVRLVCLRETKMMASSLFRLEWEVSEGKLAVPHYRWSPPAFLWSAAIMAIRLLQTPTPTWQHGKSSPAGPAAACARGITTATWIITLLIAYGQS